MTKHTTAWGALLVLILAAWVALAPLTQAAGWSQEATGLSDDLQGVGGDDGFLVAVGDTGSIVFSEDDGVTWEEINTGLTTSFYDVDVSGETAMVVGDGGQMRRSTDGGATWLSVSGVTSNDIHAVDFVDEDTGWFVGDKGVLYKTTSSGGTWTQTASKTNQTLYDVSMYSTSVGWLAGVGGILTYTGNGGTWNSQFSGVTEDLHAVHAVTDQIAFAGGASATLLMTEDAGSNWSAVSTDDLDDDDVVMAIDFVDESDGVFVTSMGMVGVTDDGGDSWSFSSIADSLTDVVALGEGDYLASSAAGNVYRYDSVAPAAPTDLEQIEDEDPVFSWTASEDPVAGYEVQVDDEGWDDIGDVTEYEVDDELDGGEHTFYVRAFDSADNASDAISIEFTIEEEEEVVDVGVDTDTLITLACDEDAAADDPCKAVYYYSDGGERHAFPNDKVYFTWYDDFDDVEEIDSDAMSAIALGANMTYHPGVKMVTFVTTNTVYTVSQGGVLRAIDSEEVAQELYGDDWADQIDDISDAFFGNYSFGDDIEDADDYDVDTETDAVSTPSDNL